MRTIAAGLASTVAEALLSLFAAGRFGGRNSTAHTMRQEQSLFDYAHGTSPNAA